MREGQPMVELETDRRRGVVNITLKYQNGKRVIVVTLQPNPSRGRLECEGVEVLKGEALRHDEQYIFITHAEREFMAVLKDWLKPRPSHVKISSLAERVELSFAYTLAHFNPKDYQKIYPLGLEDLRVLQMLARDISNAVAQLHIQARNEARKLPTGYLEDIKSSVIYQWWKDTPCTNELRDFYSSVLGRTFAWKQGQIPREQYAMAMKYLPGIKLLVGTQQQ